MKTIVVFSGAGLSQESGIPTFRDCVDGLRNNYPLALASQSGWKKETKMLLDFYRMRWENVKEAQPNKAHKAFAKLDLKHNVFHLTQNIDDLLERAGARNVFHLHGSVDFRKCEFHTSIVEGDPKFSCDYRSRQINPVALGYLCPKCGGQLRPDVTWYGEDVNMPNELIQELVPITDVFIAIGTSAVVFPAAGLLKTFDSVKEKHFIDPNPPKSLRGFMLHVGKAGEKVPELVDKIMTSGKRSSSPAAAS